MDRACEQCGTSLAGRATRARFCGSSCRRKSHDANKRNADVVQLPTRAKRSARKPAALPSATASPVPRPIERTRISESLLSSYSDDDLATPAGCIVVKLAADVDALLPGTPGYAAVVKELRGALADLESRTASRKVNPLLELRRRRAADRASG